MGFLGSLRAMKLHDCNQQVITFRTSKVCNILGFLFLVAGIAIVAQMLFGKHFYELFTICVLGLIAAAAFILIGLVLFTFNRTVRVDKRYSKVILEESSILGGRRAAFHFQDIVNVELSKDSECFLDKTASLWIVKLYLCHFDDLFVEKVFASLSPTDAKHAAETIAYASGKDLVISCLQQERLVMGRI